ncbi:MAG: GGDEF domain-containing protein [Acidiferrobacterales bacterium]|nr:GGDEF domain-containing protein [Acidiferrobacterales bacterium]
MDDRTQDMTIRESPRALRRLPVATAASPCLTVISGGTPGKVYALTLGQATVIGRGADADVVVGDPRVSRQHARVTIDANGTAVLEDLGSSNGTFLNGSRIRRQELKEGDQLQLGSGTILKFSYQNAVEQEIHRDLADRAIKDGLTDIYTEQYFLDRINTEFAYAIRHKSDLALLMFQADDLNNVRATHGAQACEFLLKELASLVKQALRAEDVFARYSETAFVVLVREIADPGVLVLAQRLRRAIKAHSFVFQEAPVPVTISIGMATGSDKAKKPAKLIEIAEKYLRRAQRAKNSIGGRAVKTLVQRDEKNSSVTIRYN